MIIERETLPGPFVAEMPDIYQIEVSSLCNFNCVMCPRTIKNRKRKDTTPYISLDLVKKLVDEDSFSGSYFVEFQMTGEPLLHPKLGEIISLVKSTGVKVGLSTNGSLIHKKIDELVDLDYVTVSVDSLSNYSAIRVNGEVGRLIENIKLLKKNTSASIDLQVVELEGWKKEFAAVKEMFPDMYLRSIPDCWLTVINEPNYFPVSRQLCLNPWLSVSIQSNGNVTSCCFSFWDDHHFGNIKDNTLKEIWDGEEVKKLRVSHEFKKYGDLCSRCYMRSPCLLHFNLFTKSILPKIKETLTYRRENEKTLYKLFRS